MRYQAILAGLLVALAWSMAAQAAPVVGKVGRLQGGASIAAAAGKVAMTEGMPVEQDQTIETGPGARLEISFVDGTSFTIGEKSKVTVDRFVFSPTGNKNVLKLAVVGPFRFISGKLSKSLGANISVTTPFATMGIRGTDVWGGPIDQRYGVFLATGIVSVTSGGKTVVLSRAGSGTNIDDAPGAQPGAITQWPKDKIGRALATVAFGQARR
jgi:hypothetical protein